MNTANLPDKVFRFTSKKALFSAPCHVLLGLSGGADSMAMLHMLAHWPVDGLRVSAIHVHHGLRSEADHDEAVVCDYCAKLGVSLSVVHVDVAAVAADLHMSLEEAGRRVRYQHYEAVRANIGADYVITAHTASDQAETMLMHLIRGCGVDGLRGIPAVRDRIRRPLLCCNRQEIEAYCLTNAIPFVTDASNYDTKFTRNDVRHRVLPLLREINPAVDEALLRLNNHATDESDYLNTLAQEALSAAECAGGYDINAFLSQHKVVRHRMIRLLLHYNAVSTIEESHIVAAERVILSGCGSVDLPGGFSLSVRQGQVTVIKALLCEQPTPISIDSLPCCVRFAESEYEIIVCDKNDANVHNLLLNCAVDYDKIQGTLCLRCRQSGDYFHAAGRSVGKSLKKWMNEWRIPSHLRDFYPILCDEGGVILIPGYGCDERVRVTDDTKHFLVCKTDAE